MNITITHGSRLQRFLQKPIISTLDPVRAEKSWWVWGVTLEDGWNGTVREKCNVYVITPLGILHRLIGLTVRIKE